LSLEKIADEGNHPRSEDYSQWYLDVVLKAELADYGPVKGLHDHPALGLRDLGSHASGHGPAHQGDGHVNAYFRSSIPKSFSSARRSTWRASRPECAWWTIGGGARARRAARDTATSEAMICSMYAKW
jgi:prolyl-tRNA synthetase